MFNKLFSCLHTFMSGQDFAKPNQVTAPNGTQTAAIRPGQGFVISDSTGQDILTLGYQKQKNLALVMNDGTTDRLMLGIFPDGSVGLIISKAGNSVYDILS